MTEQTPPAQTTPSLPARRYAPAPCPEPLDVATFVQACERVIARAHAIARDAGLPTASGFFASHIADVRTLRDLVRADPAGLSEACGMLHEFWLKTPPCYRIENRPVKTPARLRVLLHTPKAMLEREQAATFREMRTLSRHTPQWPTVPASALNRPISEAERKRYDTGDADIWDACGLSDVVTEGQRKAWGFNHGLTLAQRKAARPEPPNFIAILAELEHASMSQRIGRHAADG